CGAFLKNLDMKPIVILSCKSNRQVAQDDVCPFRVRPLNPLLHSVETKQRLQHCTEKVVPWCWICSHVFRVRELYPMLLVACVYLESQLAHYVSLLFPLVLQAVHAFPLV